MTTTDLDDDALALARYMRMSIEHARYALVVYVLHEFEALPTKPATLPPHAAAPPVRPTGGGC